MIPRLELDDGLEDKKLKRDASLGVSDTLAMPPTKVQKPAILSAVGTIGSIPMVERSKPVPKPAIIQMPGGREPIMAYDGML